VVDAIPGSSSPNRDLDETRLVPVAELLGFELPPRDIIDTLLTAYMESMHWYLNILDAPSFYNKLEPILATGLAPRSQRPFILKALAAMIMGARLLSDEVKQEKFSTSTFSLTDLVSTLTAGVERWYFPLMDSVTPDTVAFSFMMSANYLFNRQIRSAYMAIGTTVRAAESIGLHRESSWGDISTTERENRRRIWWCVFIGSGSVSLLRHQWISMFRVLDWGYTC